MIANHRATVAVGILSSLLALAAGAADDRPAGAKGKGDLAKLQGAWVGKDAVWVITGDLIVRYKPESFVLYRGTIALDPSSKPSKFDLKFGSGSHAYGIYAVEGETLRVSHINSNSEEHRPRAFEKGEFVELHAFKRPGFAKADAAAVRTTFRDNAALADESYTDHMMTVSGTILQVRRDNMSYVLVLGSGRGVRTDYLLEFDFSFTDRARLAKLKKGDKATVQGFCMGKKEGPKGEEVIYFVGSTIITAKE